MRGGGRDGADHHRAGGGQGPLASPEGLPLAREAGLAGTGPRLSLLPQLRRPPRPAPAAAAPDGRPGDRKSTRLNSSHVAISYAVFCLKKKKTTTKLEWGKNTDSVPVIVATNTLDI